MEATNKLIADLDMQIVSGFEKGQTFKSP